MDADLREASDAALVVAIARFREAALAEAYRRHGDAAFGLAVRVLRDRALAEELVQEVFLKLWHDPERFDPGRGSLRAFLMATVHSRAIDVVRAESARRARESRHQRLQPEPEYDVEREVVELALAEHVRDAFDVLSDDERRAIELAYLGGHTYREVAVLLDEPEGTVKSRIRVGLRRLRDTLVESGDHGIVDRELTRAELDELLPLYALDALDGEERDQVARYVERDADARAEVESLREAVSFLPPRDVTAPSSLWVGIEGALGAPAPELAAPPLRLVTEPTDGAKSSRGRRVVALLAAAAIVLAVVLGVQVVRQQNRIDDLAAEMHADPMEQQAMAARGSPDAHMIALDAMQGDGGAEVVMLPDGTGYLMDHRLPALDADSTYQLWAKVGDGDGARMVSLGLLGRAPGISAFHLAATPTMFEVTAEPATGSDAPGANVVLRGEVV